MKPLLSNLGFILQFSGSLVFIVALIAVFLKEIAEASAFFLTSSIFFIIGFPLNILCERKEINFRQGLMLFFLTFLAISIIGSIPYLYLNIFREDKTIEKLVNSLFESTSDFTTTGFTLLNNENLSKSLKIYRSVCHFIGGVGIVYLLLTFLYSKNSTVSSAFNKILGFEINSEIKRNVIEILAFFSVITITLSIYMYYFNRDLIKSFTTIMIGISTGGLQMYDFNTFTLPEKIIIMISMLLGSTSFFIISKLKKEAPIYILIILLFSIFLNLNNIGIFDSIFHTISIISTTGYSYINVEKLPPTVLFFASFLMLVGGMAVSTAGGIKIIRILNFFEGIKDIIKVYILEKEKEEIEGEKLFAISYVFSYVFVWIFLAVCLILYSQNVEGSLFDAAASVSNSGFSTGIVDKKLPIYLKILVIFSMILGRVEVVPFFSFLILNSSKNHLNNL